MITVVKELDKVFVYPEYENVTNVIRKINWILKFQKGSKESIASGETLIDFDPAFEFIDIDQLSDEQIVDMALDKEGGQQFVDYLLRCHSDNLVYLESLDGLVEYERK